MDKQIQNTRMLLQEAINALDEFRHGDTGGNVAKYPTVIVFLGEGSSNHLSVVKQTLDDNWSNAMHLRYINMVVSREKPICRVLKDNDEGLDNNWSDVENDFAEAMNDAVVQMLGKDDKIFSDCSAVKIDFILDAKEVDAEAYYEMYKNAKLNLNITVFSSFYLMLDQQPTYVKKCDDFLQTILNDKKCSESNIYLISNQQKNNQFLLENRIWMNYRLVANLIILGGNKGLNNDKNPLLSRGVKTAGYAIVPKPVDQIGEVTIDALLKKIYTYEKERLKKDLSLSEVTERFGIKNDYSMEQGEEIFLRILEENPQPSKNLAFFLPYDNPDGIKDLKKGNIRSIKALDARTFGTASECVERFFLNPIREYFDPAERKEDVRNEIIEWLLEKFSFFELKMMKSIIQEILYYIRHEVIDTISSARDPEYMLVMHGKSEARKIFYDRYKSLIAETLAELVEYTESFEENYREIVHEMRIERAANGEEDQTIEIFYNRLVDQYVTTIVNSCSGIAFPGVFRVNLSKQGILNAIYAEYIKLIFSHDVFRYDFEKELQERKEGMTPEESQRFLGDELATQIKGSMRINNVIDFQERRLQNYFLINEDAEYAKFLRSQPGYESREYQLINLNRTDCLEKLEIYEIPNVSLIHLVGAE